MSCRCLSILPDSMSITASAAENIAAGYCLLAKRFALLFLLSMKQAACNAVSNVFCVLERVLPAGPSLILRAAAAAAAVFAFAPRVHAATGSTSCVVAL